MIDENAAETDNSEIIKPIDRNSVHRICSGQVVLSLAIAVKELIENSIDAGATNIEVRLKEYGSELVEVSDNGCGVKKENFQALTLKHYTSKIREFTDLEAVETLGFRGEALSSLCALSDLSVVTCHKSAECGTKIIYDHNGTIINESPTAREEGTTVILSNLFSTLPVRKKEFSKNLKREFSKMCQLLYAYCLVCKNIRFSCINQTNKNSINTVVTTEGAATVRENIISVFGTKQLSTLIDVQMVLPDDALLKEYDLKLIPGDPLPFSFELIISSVTHGHGRSTTDRQFFYINSRPCEPSKVIKVVNETYRQFNGNQYPFVYLNVFIERAEVDVNVTPDKRQIFLAKEKLLLATVKASLLEAFKAFPSTLKLQNIGIVKAKSEECTSSLHESLKGLKRSASDGEQEKGSIKNGSIRELFTKRPKMETPPKKGIQTSLKLKSEQQESIKQEETFSFKPKTKEKVCVTEETKEEKPKIDILLEAIEKEKEVKSQMDVENNLVNSLIVLDEETGNSNYTAVTIDVSIEKIRQALKTTDLVENQSDTVVVKFRSKISTDSNANAEKELQKQISKDMFKQMSIIGQFNHGFIITKLNSDLFIIDQHATDEKYNFEQLQATTVLEHQVLVNPKPLELTAANESILIDNEEVFKKNGFTFKIDHKAECTKKVFLTGIPISKNYIFGKDDIDEMLFMLQDANNTMCRPSRVRSMFASRACRKSVMVGQPLSHSDMRRLVDHMGEIDQPWNCPHGRPTMRHLINLDLIHEC